MGRNNEFEAPCANIDNDFVWHKWTVKERMSDPKNMSEKHYGCCDLLSNIFDRSRLEVIMKVMKHTIDKTLRPKRNTPHFTRKEILEDFFLDKTTNLSDLFGTR